MRRRLFDRRNLSAWLALLVSLLLTLAAWYGLRMQAQRGAEQEFALHARDVLDSIEVRLRQHEQILLGGAGLFDSSVQVSREEWRIYVARLNLSQNYPGIQGVGFSQLIRPHELKAHIAAVRREGFPDYAVQPPGARPSYTSIVYLEPFSGRNLAAFGFDMMSEATRARAMHAAAESGKTAITAKVRLVQETHGKVQAGFLMYVPVYRKGMPLDTPAQRWAATRGFVYSPYRVDDLMADILRGRQSGVDFSIYDGAHETEEALMYVSPGAARAAASRFSALHRIDAYGHGWSIRLNSRADFDAEIDAPLHGVILALGSGIAGLLFALVSSLNFRRERAEELAAEMTAGIRAEKLKLSQSEARISAILDNVVDGIITINEHGKIETFNKAAAGIFGYGEEEVLGRNVKMLMPEPYRSHHDGYLLDYLGSGVRKVIGFGRQVTGQRKDGSVFPMDLAVTEMYLGKRRVFTGIVRDITERVKIERMKSEFISTVSHELRTPLTSIRGSLSLLAADVLGELPAAAKPMVDIAHKNSERLILLVNDILDMEKIEAGKMEFELRPVELMPLLRQSLESNRAYADQHHVSYEVESELPGAMVRVDANRLLQVLANLLSNAAKFSPPGDKVAVAVEQRGDHVRIAVKDHGSGIPEAFKGNIFQKFAQADASDSRKKGGTGLGLSITKAIVEQMGGSIGFESQPKLTVFHVEFPQWQECGPEVDRAHDISAPRVLVCEDSRDAATVLRKMLEQGGYAVDIAYDAGQAKKLLEQGGYVAMTLDLALPTQSGLSLLRELRGGGEENAALPVLVVSATASEGGRATSGEALGIVGWLDKPVNHDQLLAALSRLVHPPERQRARVLHVEDDVDVCQVVGGVLRDVAETERAGSLGEARRMLERGKYDLVILDLALPGGDGQELLPMIKSLVPRVPVVVFSAFDIGAEHAGKVDAVLLKSRTDNSQLLATVKRLVGIA